MELKIVIMFFLFFAIVSNATIIANNNNYVISFYCLDNCTNFSLDVLEPSDIEAGVVAHNVELMEMNNSIGPVKYYFEINSHKYPAFLHVIQKVMDYPPGVQGEVTKDEWLIVGVIPYSKDTIVNIYTRDGTLLRSFDFCNDDGICQNHEDVLCDDCREQFNVKCAKVDPLVTDSQPRCAPVVDNSTLPITVSELDDKKVVDDFAKRIDGQNEKSACCVPVLFVIALFAFSCFPWFTFLTFP